MKLKKTFAFGTAMLTFTAGLYMTMRGGSFLKNQFVDFVRQHKPLYHIEVPAFDQENHVNVRWKNRLGTPTKNYNILSSNSLDSILEDDNENQDNQVLIERVNPRGFIPIMSLHGVNRNEQEKTSISPEKLYERLESLYEYGFVLVNLDDLVQNNLDSKVPKGRKPLVLTLDDARRDQFDIIEKEKKYYVDPNSALGVLETFVKNHPDFNLKATFFIDFDNVPFGDLNQLNAKIDYLKKKGFSFGAHSVTGRSFDRLNLDEIHKEIAESKRIIEQMTGQQVKYFAAPTGIIPKDLSFNDIRSFVYNERNINLIPLKITNSMTPSPKTTDLSKILYLKRWRLDTTTEEFNRLFDPKEREGDFYVSLGTNKKQDSKIIDDEKIEEHLEDKVSSDHNSNASNSKKNSFTDFDGKIVNLVPYRLTNMIKDDRPARIIEVNVDVYLLQRMIPLVEKIEEAAARYKLNPSWTFQLYILESELNPQAVNEESDDYGLTQMKMQNFSMGIELVSREEDYRSNLLNIGEKPNVFNPEHAIIASAARMRYLIEKFNLIKPEQIAAIYKGGPRSIGKNGWYSQGQREYINAHASRAEKLRPLVVAISWNEEDINSLYDENIKNALMIYHKYHTPVERYRALLDYNMKHYFSDKKKINSWYSSLLFNNTIIFAKTLEKAYEEKDTDIMQKLEIIVSEALISQKGKPFYYTIEKAAERLRK